MPYSRRQGGEARWRLVVTAVVLTLAAACGTDSVEQPGSDLVEVDLEVGRELYVASCAMCHGAEGQGTDTGPPLVDEIYRTAHHGDITFFLAVNTGVRPHHWNFGPMLPIEGLSDADITQIVAYVRSLQEQAGID
jgi:mono/diheme cytochrome c family protein